MPENIGNINIIRETLDGTPADGSAPVDPTGSLTGVHVAVETTASADELWESWQALLPAVEDASNRATETSNQWRQATDPVVKEQLWADYESATRTYRVLASWREVMYAAHVFATDGVACGHFVFGPPQFDVPPAPASGPPQF